MKVILAPGASASAQGMAPLVDGLRQRGIDASAIDLPRGAIERGVAVFAGLCAADVVIGGQSFGGRAASLAAAQPGAELAGLLLFSFPLSGKPDERTAHFPAIRCPTLILNGERDPLSPFAVMREKARLLPNGRLVGFANARHGFRDALEAKLDAAAAFLSALR